MVGERIEKAAERAWKHRFAQTLYEFFCIAGLERSAALDDAYAHADAQYLVRGVRSPEDEARSALAWIRADAPATAANRTDGDAHAPNPHNGAHHVDGSGMDLSAQDEDASPN